MSLILPERTVEAWTTAYIVRWHPHARIWAPTQNDPAGWDHAFDLARSAPAGHRAFVFEYKGVDVGGVISIDTRQLLRYVTRGLSNVLWYLLPGWNVTTGPGVVPTVAQLRTIRSSIPFEAPDPPRAIELPGPRRDFAIARGCEAYFYVVALDAMRAWIGSSSAARKALRVEDIPELAHFVTLEHFLEHRPYAGAIPWYGIRLLQTQAAAQRAQGAEHEEPHEPNRARVELDDGDIVAAPYLTSYVLD